MVGLIASENRFVSYGTVQFAFAYLGKDKPAASGQASIIETGRFLPVPGSTAAEGQPGPVAVSGADARGHYLTRQATPGALHDLHGDLFARLGVDGTAQYLVRPDGHIGYRAGGDDLAGLQRYLARWLPNTTSRPA